MRVDSSEPACSLHLLDVLEQLPRDVLRQNIWLPLAHVGPRPFSHLPHHLLPGRAFRLACRRSLALTDQLTQRACLVCAPDTHRDGGESPSEGVGTASRAPTSTHTAAAVQSHGAFLARQEGLQLLLLVQEDARDDAGTVLSSMLHLGGTACRRLHALHIMASAPCSAALRQAVTLCCPNIQELVLTVDAVEAVFFAPLRKCGGLMKVEVRSTQAALNCDGLLRTLSTLPRLRSVSLDGSLHDGDELSHLVAITQLCELRLGLLFVDVADGDAARLGALLGGLTHLTTLEVPTWVSDEDGFCDAAVAQLGGLRRLTSLRIGESFHLRNPPLGGDGLSTVLRLSALTHLACVPFAPQEGVGAGHLPQLRRLELLGALCPRSLAATLRPLLPLPELRQFKATVRLADEAGASAAAADAADGADFAGAGGRATAAAWQAGALLAQAPHLEQVELTLYGGNPPTQWSLGIATALLVPLLEHLVDLRLGTLAEGSLEVLWPLLCRAPRLRALQVFHCWLPESVLLLVGRLLPALRQLRVASCYELGADSTVALAAARVLPLRLTWSPPT